MSELVEGTIPTIQFVSEPESGEGWTPPIQVESEPVTEEAPYGYKADGTPAKKRGRPAGSSSSGGRRSASRATMEAELADKIVELTMPVSVFSPLAGAVIDERAERTARALVQLGGQSARFKKALDTFLKGAAYADLAMLPFAIGVAVMVDYQRISVESGISRKLHLDQHWVRLYGPDGVELIPQNNGHIIVPDVDSRSGLFG